MIPDETVSRIRERADIVEVVGEHVQLRRAGANYKGLCPFHQEKTPSFNVNANRQMFHCFGCGEGGDVFTFLMRYEGRTFVDAVRDLGRRYGIDVEEQQAAPGAREARQRRQAERERMLQAMERAARFYREQLLGELGAEARRYLGGRGIDAELAERFGLGYAPEGWDHLTRALKGLQVSPAEAERLGLVVGRRGGGGFYDRMRDRLIFPVHDAAGRVVAFGGRVLPGAPDDAPKYVNSPESPVFSKGSILYGLSVAREAMRHGEAPILVEGYLDVISMHAAGLTSAVAPMGTALTPEQASLLRRFGGRDVSPILLFDGDAAGAAAVARAQPALAQAGLGGRVVVLPAGDDPDSFVRAEGPEAVRLAIDGAKGLVEHLVDEAAALCGADNRSKARAIRGLWPALSGIKDPLERDLYKKRIAAAFDVGEELVFRYLRGAEPDAVVPEAPQRRVVTARARAEATLVGALLDAPFLAREVLASSDVDLIREPASRWVVEHLVEAAEGGLDPNDLVEAAPDPALGRRIRARLVNPKFADPDVARRAAEESLSRLRELTERDEARRLQTELNQAVLEGDGERATSLAQEKLQRRRYSGPEAGGASGRF